jgi:GxxExxY protein
MKYIPIIGLEIHVELNTKSKMFCSCPNDPDERHPNVNVCPICMGHPGVLPVINEEAVKKTIKTGLALNCQIPEYSKFDRKNYFYPDLPKGYQISQKYMPFCKEGFLEIDGGKIRVREVHLEEDVGRLIHGKNYSLVDFNRAGIPLMELVTEPDICSAKEARKFAEELQLILRYLDVSDADMEKGEMRCEVNVSIRPNKERTLRPNKELIKTNGKRIVLAEESYKLMKLLFEIHNKLGAVYKEKNYQDAIEEILKREKISYEREKRIPLEFENLKISDFFADFVIDNKILLEVKAEKFITQNDVRQTLRYIKSANLPLGIIVNFRRDRLEYKRLINPLFDFNSLSFVKNSSEALGTKVEIKNLNSFKAVEQAINYEIERQTKILKAGKKVIQETRGWDDIRGVTVSQREKEYAHDYRYFPEPDLLPLHFEKEEIEKIRAEIPELPRQKRERFEREYELDEKSIEIFVQNKDLGGYFEKVISELPPKLPKKELPKLIKLASNYLITDLQGLLKGCSVTGENFLITPEDFAEFITLIDEGKISSKIAKTVLEEMFRTGADPSQIIEEKGLSLITDKAEIEKIVKEVISKNQKAVLDFKKGKENALQFLIGQVMAKTKGKANPEIVKNLLTRMLKSPNLK